MFSLFKRDFISGSHSAEVYKMNFTVDFVFQFLLIFRKAAAGELKNDGLMEVYRHIAEVDVGAEGVKGAKNFFQAKVLQQ